MLNKVAFIDWLQEHLFSTNQDPMEKYKLGHLNNAFEVLPLTDSSTKSIFYIQNEAVSNFF